MTKYRNQRTKLDGIVFDSKAEANRYAELKLRERIGDIRDLRLQSRIKLFGKNGEPLKGPSGRALCYVADFDYITKDGAVIVEDVKGMQTPLFKLKRAILKAQGIDVTVVK